MSDTKQPSAPETRFAGVPRDPEALDEVVGVTPLRGWLALASICITLVSVAVWSVTATIPQQFTVAAVIGDVGSTTSIIAGATGSVEKLAIQPGQDVAVGDQVATIRALDGDVVEVVARVAGVVREILVETGQGVEALDTIAATAVTGPGVDDGDVVTFVSGDRAVDFARGATIYVDVSDVAADSDEVLPARVTSVAEVPTSLAGIEAEIGDSDLAQQLLEAADGVAYRVEVTVDDEAVDVVGGQITAMTVVYANPHPIQLLFGGKN